MKTPCEPSQIDILSEPLDSRRSGNSPARQGLAPTCYCLDPREILFPGQDEELTRVMRAYSELIDDAFVAENRERWPFLRAPA